MFENFLGAPEEFTDRMSLEDLEALDCFDIITSVVGLESIC